MHRLEKLLLDCAGDEEYPASGQDSTWFSQLSNATQAKSVQIDLAAPTGAALQSQAGSPIAGTAPLFAALNPIMGVRHFCSSAVVYLCLIRLPINLVTHPDQCGHSV